MCDRDSDCFCVKCHTKPVHEKLEDWAKIKAHREAFPNRWYHSDTYILHQWSGYSRSLNALARRIQRDDTPPVPQDVLIWREAWARIYNEEHPDFAKEYREGLRDRYRDNESALSMAIKLALEGFGKEVT